VELVDQFITSCIGTLPSFESIGTTFDGTEFRQSSDRSWIRDSDSATIRIEETEDRYVCLAGLIGDFTAEFTTAITDRLEANELGRFEPRVYQGRSLFLLQAPGGMTILEVIPPYGATTFLVANARKE
jgi:hypothetical protein